MSKKHMPSRGPRIMHGMADMLAKARLLPHALGQANLAQPAERPIGVSAQEAEAQAALDTLLRRLQRAERTVQRIQLMVCALQEQCDAQPADSLARVVCETVLTGVRSALDAEDKAAKEAGNAANAGS